MTLTEQIIYTLALADAKTGSCNIAHILMIMASLPRRMDGRAKKRFILRISRRLYNGKRSEGHDTHRAYSFDSLGYYVVPDRADLYRREIMQTLTHADTHRSPVSSLLPHRCCPA